jgi:hypothetical protein
MLGMFAAAAGANIAVVISTTHHRPGTAQATCRLARRQAVHAVAAVKQHAVLAGNLLHDGAWWCVA